MKKSSKSAMWAILFVIFLIMFFQTPLKSVACYISIFGMLSSGVKLVMGMINYEKL